MTDILSPEDFAFELLKEYPMYLDIPSGWIDLIKQRDTQLLASRNEWQPNGDFTNCPTCGKLLQCDGNT